MKVYTTIRSWLRITGKKVDEWIEEFGPPLPRFGGEGLGVRGRSSWTSDVAPPHPQPLSPTRRGGEGGRIILVGASFVFPAFLGWIAPFIPLTSSSTTAAEPTFWSVAQTAARPAGLPNYDDVVFSIRWNRPQCNLSDAQRFHANRIEWSYIWDYRWAREVVDQGYHLSGALVSSLPDTLPTRSVEDGSGTQDESTYEVGRMVAVSRMPTLNTTGGWMIAGQSNQPESVKRRSCRIPTKRPPNHPKKLRCSFALAPINPMPGWSFIASNAPASEASRGWRFKSEPKI